MTGLRTKRIARWSFVILAVGVLGGAASYVYWAVFDYRFLVVTEGQVYRSAAMPPEILQSKVWRYGIRSVIDLRKPGGDVIAERDSLSELGIRHFSLPSHQVPSQEAVAAFLEIIDRLEYRPVLIHCNDGIGRAVLFSAIYRVEYEGWSNEEARSTAYWRSGLGSFEPDSRKGAYIRSYVSRRLLASQESNLARKFSR